MVFIENDVSHCLNNLSCPGVVSWRARGRVGILEVRLGVPQVVCHQAFNFIEPIVGKGVGIVGECPGHAQGCRTAHRGKERGCAFWVRYSVCGGDASIGPVIS